MKKKFLIALTIILVLCISCALFACNDSNPSADSREKAIENFQNAYLKACSDNWSLNLSSEEQKELYNEGHYVYQKELAAFYADVLKSSTIRTQKITALNEQLLYNEELKKLIREGRLNYDKLLTLFSDTGLIAEDISELVYLTASKFINEGYDTASSILTKVTAIYEKAAQRDGRTAVCTLCAPPRGRGGRRCGRRSRGGNGSRIRCGTAREGRRGEHSRTAGLRAPRMSGGERNVPLNAYEHAPRHAAGRVFRSARSALFARTAQGFC